MSDYPGYLGKYQIRSNEIDPFKSIKFPSFIQLMQEASLQNAMQLKASVWDLEDQKLSWVLVKKHIEINAYPQLGDHIKIQTHPVGVERIFAYRDFHVFDQNENEIATASSIWVLMNTETRKIVRVPEMTFTKYQHKNPLPKPPKNIQPIGRIDFSNTYKINWFNLDWNGHVNNVFMVHIMAESVSDEYLRQNKIQHFTIHYKNESLLHDVLIVETQINEMETIHKIVRESDQAIIAIASAKWQSK